MEFELLLAKAVSDNGSINNLKKRLEEMYVVG